MATSTWSWIDVFAIPEKCFMVVTESSLDPIVREMSITILMTVRPLGYACRHGAEMLLTLKNIFDLNIARYFELWHSIEMSHDFVCGQSVT